ncbi:SOS response-associated peptidase [Candidatus Magnetominusculus dajiuhuensis]|uniref:SOS response-associated peptidase n=1 Tax=Candidatus Magnetominusculus dajiuhuensis TaxID=3137712 RepID=UPI003B42E482
MCGRFVRTSETRVILREFDAGGGVDIAPSYNVAPSQVVAAIVNKDDKRELVLCRWGFVPHWAKDISAVNKAINARAETVAANRAFSVAFKDHRCLIAANGFYEWRRGPGTKTPVFIRLKSAASTPFGFAGLYSTRPGAGGGVLHTCTIITTTANALIGKIHHRMPVIIHRCDYGLWLGHEADAMSGLLRPYPDDEMEAAYVSTMVNSTKNNSPECIEPIKII